jgi:ferredoxin-fold anticodon binding domain-containing protein
MRLLALKKLRRRHLKQERKAVSNNFAIDTDKEVLRNILNTQEVVIKFTKTNGENREMRCTLSEGLVPQYEKKTERVKNANAEVQPVFDLDKQAWRSFRWDSVTEFSFNN